MLSLASAVHAQRLAPVTPGSPQAEADRPGGRYALLRQDEDWSYAPADGRGGPFDRLKHFAIDRHGNISASVAVDGYVSFRQYTNQLLGRVPGPNPALNTRLNVHVGVDLDDRVRLYAALKHGDNEYGAEPVAPVDRNRLDLHQAFVQFNFGDAFGGERKDVLVRVGRQEISYGAGRLISARLGVTCVPERSARDMIGRGELVRCLDQWDAGASEVYALYPSRRALGAGARAFIDHLAKSLEF